MGAHQNIAYDRFPVQGKALGMPVDVVTSSPEGLSDTAIGVVVRDDQEAPFVKMIELDDGSVVLGPESGSYIPTSQGDWLGRETQVCFHNDTTRTLEGVTVRDDLEEPNKRVIKLNTGKFVLSTECMVRAL